MTVYAVRRTTTFRGKPIAYIVTRWLSRIAAERDIATQTDGAAYDIVEKG